MIKLTWQAKGFSASPMAEAAARSYGATRDGNDWSLRVESNDEASRKWRELRAAFGVNAHTEYR